jgi:hypothetical protein
VELRGRRDAEIRTQATLDPAELRHRQADRPSDIRLTEPSRQSRFTRFPRDAGDELPTQ